MLTRSCCISVALLITAALVTAGCNDASSVSTPQPPPPPQPTVLTVTTTSPLAGTVNSPFSATLTAVAGTPPFVWTIIGNQPPGPGLTLNSATGTISGTPTSASSTTRRYLVIDSTTPTAQTAEKEITITIAATASAATAMSPTDASPTPVIVPFTLPNGTVNAPYPPLQLQAVGGTPPYTWSVTPSLPGGLSLNLLGPGVISGLPLEPTRTPTIHRFQVMDSSQPTARISEATQRLAVYASLHIDHGVPDDPVLPAGTVGHPYHTSLSASGGTGPGTVHWSLVESLSPAPGLTLAAASGAIGGIPTIPGTFVRTYRVQDGKGNMTQKPLVVTIHDRLTIDTDNDSQPLAFGVTGQAYEAQLSASGGTGPGTYQWRLADESIALPEGLQLSLEGTISGIPRLAGSFSLTLLVTDGASSTATKQVSVAVMNDRQPSATTP